MPLDTIVLFTYLQRYIDVEKITFYPLREIFIFFSPQILSSSLTVHVCLRVKTELMKNGKEREKQ